MSNSDVPEAPKQVITGPGKLREKIRRVSFVADAEGNPLEQIAIRVGKAWHLLDAKKLVQGKSEELARIASRCRIPLDIKASDRRKLCDQILAAQEGQLVVLAPSGYQQVRHDGGTAEVFVWRGKPKWVEDVPDLAWMINDAGSPGRSGSLDEWKAYAECFKGNHYLVVGLGAALSALLAKPLGVDTLSLICVGRSSIGKGATQKAIESIIRPPNLGSASGTARGLQQSLSEYSGQPVFLEDLRQQKDPQALVDLLFDVGNRSSRSVGHASQAAVVGKPMECLIVASNERTIRELLGGSKYEAGLEARVLEVQVREVNGAFHQIPKGMDGRTFSDHLKAGAAQWHGAVWDEWVEFAASRLNSLRTLWQEKQEDLLLSLAEDIPTDGLTQRVLKGMAFWKFCLTIAAKKELVPLMRGEIDESFRYIVRAHLQERRLGLPQHTEGVIDAMRSFIHSNPGKFPRLTPTAMRQDGVWGFEHEIKEQRLYLFYPHWLDKLLIQDVGKSTVVHALRTAGLLFANSGRDDRVVKMPDGTSVRMFAVRASILSDE